MDVVNSAAMNSLGKDYSNLKPRNSIPRKGMPVEKTETKKVNWKSTVEIIETQDNRLQPTVNIKALSAKEIAPLALSSSSTKPKTPQAITPISKTSSTSTNSLNSNISISRDSEISHEIELTKTKQAIVVQKKKIANLEARKDPEEQCLLTLFLNEGDRLFSPSPEDSSNETSNITHMEIDPTPETAAESPASTHISNNTRDTEAADHRPSEAQRTPKAINRGEEIIIEKVVTPTAVYNMPPPSAKQITDTISSIRKEVEKRSESSQDIDKNRRDSGYTSDRPASANSNPQPMENLMIRICPEDDSKTLVNSLTTSPSTNKQHTPKAAKSNSNTKQEKQKSTYSPIKKKFIPKATIVPPRRRTPLRLSPRREPVRSQREASPRPRSTSPYSRTRQRSPSKKKPIHVQERLGHKSMDLPKTPGNDHRAHKEQDKEDHDPAALLERIKKLEAMLSKSNN